MEEKKIARENRNEEKLSGSWRNFMQLGVLTVSVCIRW